MPRRSTSLSNLAGSAITREIDSKYDVVKAVRENLGMLEELNSTDFDALISELESAQDFTGIAVVSGTVASWDAATKTLTVPTVKGDKGDIGAKGDTGEQGLKGDTGSRGPTGLKGDKGDVGSEGSRGATGDKGDKGEAGLDGTNLTIEQIVYNNNGTFTWQFSDGTDYVTPYLLGEKGDVGSKGDKGDTGVSVHHTKGTSTTDLEGDFTSAGEVDTYTMYGDADETIVLGWFSVINGSDPYDYAVEGGYIGTRDDFTRSLSSITATEVASQLAQWKAQANEMTANSYANSPIDTEVSTFVSNGDGTFVQTVQSGEYSSYHYQVKTYEDYQRTLGLGKGYVAASLTARDALEGLTTADTVFVVDDGDGKWSRYQVIEVTDGSGNTSSFEKIMDEDIYLNANTAEDIKAAYESNLDTNAFTDAEKVKLADTEISSQLNDRDVANRNVDNHIDGSTNGVYTLAERAKLFGIEAGSTGDQTDSEIKIAYENNANTNVYTDAEKLKVGHVAVTQAVDLDTIKSDTNSNNVHKISDGSDHTFINQDVTDTADVQFNSIAVTTTVDGRNISVDGTKLDTIEENAKDDQTGAEIKELYESEADTNVYDDLAVLEVAKIVEKQDILVSQEHIKSINGNSIVGSGDLVIAAGSGGFASDLYFSDEVSDISSYKKLSYAPDVASTNEVIVCNNGETSGNTYLFDLPIDTSLIDAGKWVATLYCSVSSNDGDTRVRYEGFMRASNGAETTLFSIMSPELTTDVGYVGFENTQPVQTVDPDSRYGIRLFASTTSISDRTVTITIGGGNASYTNTPLAIRHDQLRARDMAGAHPISAIEGLSTIISELTDVVEW